MGALRNLAAVLFILCIPAALVTTTIRFLANEPRVYRYAIDDFGGVLASGIERDELLRASKELIAYFNSDEVTVSIRVEEGGREVSLFNPRETAHLKDVKDRFQIVNRVQEFSVIFLITYVGAVVLWAREVGPRRLAIQVMLGNVITLIGVGALGAVSLSGFESSWEDFHTVLFSNDFWRLNPATDHLIQIFPVAFWEDIVFFAGLLIVAQAALFTLTAGIYLGVTGRTATAAYLSPSYG